MGGEGQDTTLPIKTPPGSFYWLGGAVWLKVLPAHQLEAFIPAGIPAVLRPLPPLPVPVPDLPFRLAGAVGPDILVGQDQILTCLVWVVHKLIAEKRPAPLRHHMLLFRLVVFLDPLDDAFHIMSIRIVSCILIAKEIAYRFP